MISKKVLDTDYKNYVQPWCNIKDGPWVAGGSARKVWQGLPWKNQDIDFFFASKRQFDHMLANINAFGNVEKLCETANALTYTFCRKLPKEPEEPAFKFDTLYNLNELLLAKPQQLPKNNLKIQLIKKEYYSSVEHLLSTFDITVTQFASDGINVFATLQAVDDLSINVIRPVGKTLAPNRVIKYAAYGFEPDPCTFRQALHSIHSGGLRDNSY